MNTPSFEIWLQNQPAELRELLQLAYSYGKIAGMDIASDILKRNTK